MPTRLPPDVTVKVTVGCRALDVLDALQGVKVPAWVLYPSRAAERLEQFGPYSLEVAPDAPVEGERLPLVILSHGTGSSPWVFRGLAAHLTRAGFVVALLEHPGNSRSDNSLAHTAVNLENRPRHVRLVLDAVLADGSLGERLTPTRVGMIGHSLGACTALATAGGHPSCFPEEAPDGQTRVVPVVHDPRVHALVLLAPASVWFRAEGALAEVDIPILMLSGQADEITPAAVHAQLVLRGLRHPERVQHRMVPNAGHFSFQSPFPPSMTRPEFAPSRDPEGFDRSAFQPILHGEIAAFLRDHLSEH